MNERDLYETGQEPEFFITEMRLEQVPGNNVRARCIVRRAGTPQVMFTMIIPHCMLAQMGRQFLAGWSELAELAFDHDRPRLVS